MTKCNEFSTTSTGKSDISLVGSKLIPRADSKIELRNVTVKQFLLLSRIADEEARKKLDLPDDWNIHLKYECELEALGDYIFLSRKGALREYMLVAQLTPPLLKLTPPWMPTAEELNDCLADI